MRMGKVQACIIQTILLLLAAASIWIGVEGQRRLDACRAKGGGIVDGRCVKVEPITAE